MGSSDPLLEIWDPLISWEPLKLETSNLARRRTALSSNEKCKISSKGLMWGHLTQFSNLGTPTGISETVEATADRLTPTLRRLLPFDGFDA